MQNVEKKTLQNRLHAAEQEIASLRKQLDELDAPKVVQGRYVSEPEVGKTYFKLWGYGDISHTCYGRRVSDKNALISGNAFATREAAQKELSRRQAMQALRCCEGARGFVRGSDNYGLYWGSNRASWGVEHSRLCVTVGDAVYFDTREQALSAINSLTPEHQDALK